METKLTLSSVSVFISTLKFKLFTFFLILNSVFAFAQTCNANLEVVKNRNIRSTASEGTYYKMSITNNGSSDDVYSLSSLNINNICTHNNRKVKQSILSFHFFIIKGELIQLRSNSLGLPEMLSPRLKS